MYQRPRSLFDSYTRILVSGPLTLQETYRAKKCILLDKLKVKRAIMLDFTRVFVKTVRLNDLRPRAVAELTVDLR